MTSRPLPGSIVSVVLLIFLVALCAATFLFAPVTITLDGYSHLYNAGALRWMLAGQPAAHAAFTWNSWLIPNWATALILAAFSAVLPAAIALRILILLVAAALVLGLSFCIDAESAGERAQALIVLLPFALSAFLLAGFYDFLLSAAICFFVLGLELRQSASMRLRTEVTIAILLLTAWLSHPLPLALTFLFPAALCAGDVIAGDRPVAALHARLRHLWPWAPPLFLMAGFYLRLRTVAPTVPEMSVARRLIVRLRQLAGPELAAISPSGNSAFLFVALIVVLLLAVILTVTGKPAHRDPKTRRRFSALLLLGVFTLLLFPLVPDGVGDASAIPARVLLLALLFLVLTAFGRGVADPVMRIAAVTISALIVVGFSWEYWTVSRFIAPAQREIDAAMHTLPLHARILIAGYRIAPECKGPALLERSVPDRHWAVAGALHQELIVLNDYEGHTSHFPLRYADDNTREVEEVRTGFPGTTAAWMTVLNGPPLANYVVAWGTSHGTESVCPAAEPPPFEAALRDRYQLIESKDGASHVEIWKSQ